MSYDIEADWQLKPITHDQDYLHIPFHALSGTDVEVNGRNGGVDFSSTFAISGTTANIWDNAGYITPAGDNHVSMKGDSNISDLLIADGKAGFLVQVTMKATRSGSDTLSNTILKVNSLGGVGGYEITMANFTNMNANFNFFYAGEGNAGAPSLSFTSPVDRTDEDVSLWAYVDFTRLNHSLNGTRANTADNVGWDCSSGTLFSSIDSNQDISLLSGHSTGPTPNNFCNAGLATVLIHDLRVWPFYTPPSIPDIYHAVSSYGKYPYEDFQR